MEIKTNTKIIKVGDREIPMRISGATYILYRNEFKDDMLVKLTEINANNEEGTVTLPEGAVDTLLKMAYIMAKQGGEVKESFVEWLDTFSFNDSIDKLISSVYQMINDDQETLDEAKKKDEE